MIELSLPLNRVTLRGETGGKVKALRGYQKGRQVDTSEEAHEDVEKHFTLLREHLKYKRKEVEVEKLPSGGAIRTPDFEYTVSLDVSAEAPDEVVWRREIANIRNAELLKSPAFRAVFGDTFDTLIFRFPKERDVAGIVDAIEEEEPAGVKVDCPSDCAWCDISFEGRAGRIHIRPDRLEVHDPRAETSGGLVDTFHEIQKFFAGLGTA